MTGIEIDKIYPVLLRGDSGQPASGLGKSVPRGRCSTLKHSYVITSGCQKNRAVIHVRYQVTYLATLSPYIKNEGLPFGNAQPVDWCFLLLSSIFSTVPYCCRFVNHELHLHVKKKLEKVSYFLGGIFVSVQRPGVLTPVRTADSSHQSGSYTRIIARDAAFQGYWS
jgi:hypothetical protein